MHLALSTWITLLIDYNVKHFYFLCLDVGCCLKTAILGKTKFGFLNVIRDNLLVIGGRTYFGSLLFINESQSLHNDEHTYIYHQHASDPSDFDFDETEKQRLMKDKFRWLEVPIERIKKAMDHVDKQTNFVKLSRELKSGNEINELVMNL